MKYKITIITRKGSKRYASHVGNSISLAEYCEALRNAYEIVWMKVNNMVCHY